MNVNNKKESVWYKRLGFWAQVLIIIGSSFGILAATDGYLFDRFSVDLLRSPNRFVLFVIYGLLIASLRVGYELLKNNNNNVVYNSDDSLLKMIEEAYVAKKYYEVVKIGGALSNALWYCGKNELRIRIAAYVKRAAMNIEDEYVLSKTLIEDLGNGRIEIKRDIDEAIRCIQNGIDYANNNDYFYLSARGYRNLACAYLLRYNLRHNQKDLKDAIDQLASADEKCEAIKDGNDKLDAMGSIWYAKFRYNKLQNNITESIQCLEKSMFCHKQQALSPEDKSLAYDRLIKIYRELGALYLYDDNRSNNMKGIEYINKSMRMAESQNGYSSALRAGIVLLRYYLGNNMLLDIPSLVVACDGYAEKTEYPSFKIEYEKLKKDYENITS